MVGTRGVNCQDKRGSAYRIAPFTGLAQAISLKVEILFKSGVNKKTNWDKNFLAGRPSRPQPLLEALFG
jgi:hypothetical protein